MRTVLRSSVWAGVLLGAAFGGVAPAAAQDTVGATIDRTFGMVEVSFVGLAEAMPADAYDFRPTAGVRTFAEQVRHVACANIAFFNEIEKRTPPDGCETGGPNPAKTKPEIVAYLKESFAYARKVLATVSAVNAMEAAGGPYGGQSTKLGLSTLAVWHASDHYGQLVVYARLKGVTPPASRR